VVSLLTPEESSELSLDREGEYCATGGIGFRSLPIPDLDVPDQSSQAERLVGEMDATLSQGKNILIHCRQGVGRSGMMAAALLVESGLSPSEATRRVGESRGVPVPETARQRAWIESLATARNQM
jgi:protein-tyrosine phosphatase